MKDLIVQFARLWGQREAWDYSEEDVAVSEMLKEYDSEELLQLLETWADEFISNKENEDTVEFFEQKIEELYSANVQIGFNARLKNAVQRSVETESDSLGKDDYDIEKE